jgi:hypothetical protein
MAAAFCCQLPAEILYEMREILDLLKNLVFLDIVLLKSKIYG